jgi:hypothetical protein
MDIGLNFMERWAKQAGKLHLKDMTHLDHHGDLHLPDGWDVFAVRGAAWGRDQGRCRGGVGAGMKAVRRMLCSALESQAEKHVLRILPLVKFNACLYVTRSACLSACLSRWLLCTYAVQACPD